MESLGLFMKPVLLLRSPEVKHRLAGERGLLRVERYTVAERHGFGQAILQFPGPVRPRDRVAGVIPSQMKRALECGLLDKEIVHEQLASHVDARMNQQKTNRIGEFMVAL
jgi:hypothetical protein